MDSYTAMSDEAIMATIDAMQEMAENKYPLDLNADDFSNLMWALQCVTQSEAAPHLRDWAASFASGIGETLGIDYV